MRFAHESVFLSTLRAFFSMLFGTIGVACGVVLVLIFLGLLFSSKEERHHVDSNVEILSDAKGSRKALPLATPVILQINIEGEIGKGYLTAEDIQEILLSSREKSFKNDRVKAIFLSINSPGGSANETYLIYQMLMEYKKRYQVPIYAYVDGLSASGSYYIACAADKILATEVSLIGSVGVISWPPFFNVKEALDKLGVDTKTISAGKGKDAMNPTRKWLPDEDKEDREIVAFLYEEFVDRVVASRPHLSKEVLVNEIGAGVLPPALALDKGMIDGIVVYRTEALEQLVENANLGESYQVVCFKTAPWWRDLMKEKFSNTFFSGKVRHEIALPERKSFSYSSSL